MTNPLNTIRGTLIAGVLLTGLAVIIVRVFAVIN